MKMSSTTEPIPTPFAKQILQHLRLPKLLGQNQCASFCGAENQFCCTTGEACFTNSANVAFCSLTKTSTGTVSSSTATITASGCPFAACGAVCCGPREACKINAIGGASCILKTTIVTSSTKTSVTGTSTSSSSTASCPPTSPNQSGGKISLGDGFALLVLLAVFALVVFKNLEDRQFLIGHWRSSSFQRNESWVGRTAAPDDGSRRWSLRVQVDSYLKDKACLIKSTSSTSKHD